MNFVLIKKCFQVPKSKSAKGGRRHSQAETKITLVFSRRLFLKTTAERPKYTLGCFWLVTDIIPIVHHYLQPIFGFSLSLFIHYSLSLPKHLFSISFITDATS